MFFTITESFNGCVLKEFTTNAEGTSKSFSFRLNGNILDNYTTNTVSPYSYITVVKNIGLSTGDYLEIRNNGTLTNNNYHIFHIRCPND